MNIDKSQRIHGIDALRAVAMLLGILLHATIAYKEKRIPTWPYDNSFHHWGFDYTYIFIHSFRMPLFFLIAGYFCRFLLYKIGEKAFIIHRSKRILIPFLFSLIIILPLTIFPFLVFRYSTIYPGQWQIIFHNSIRQLFHWNGMAHLWFLYYLLIYYATVIALFHLHQIPTVRKMIDNISHSLAYFHPGSRWGVLIAAVPVWSLLLTVKELYLHVNTGILPEPAYLLFYAWFFMLGWLINKVPNAFGWMMKNVWVLILLGTSLSVIIFLADYLGYIENYWKLIFIKLLVAFQIVLLVYGVIGFFLRYCRSGNRLWRYISDATYWMYLLHLSLVAGLQVFFMNTAVPGILRFPLVLLITVPITLVTYHFWIRYTIIGKYLHGQRKRPGLTTG